MAIKKANKMNIRAATGSTINLAITVLPAVKKTKLKDESKGFSSLIR